MIKAIIFDFDGTLCTTHGLGFEAMQRTAEKFDETISKEKWASFEGLNREEKIKKAFPSKAKEMIPTYNDFYETIFVERAEPLGNAIEALEQLKKNHKLFIFSTKYTDSINKGLTKFGIKDCFLEVLGKENLEKQKPDKWGVEFLLSKYSFKREEVVLVGDSLVDEQASKNAGIRFIQFVNPKEEKNVLGNYSKIRSHLELVTLLPKL